MCTFIAYGNEFKEPSLLFNMATTDKVVFREIGLCPIHTADADATKQFRRVGGVYWALGVL